jgi:hypothetical protein
VQIVYFSHSYRQEDGKVNDFFSRLMESENLVLSLDPPSESVNAAKLQRHLNSADGMVAVVTRRADGVSPYVMFEMGLALRSRKPLLVFVEDVLPDRLLAARVLQRRFSRGGFLRQVREHRHAIRVFKSYLGDEPPPRYQPDVSQRSCVLAGEDTLPDEASQAVESMLMERGYRIVRASDLIHHQVATVEALSQADVALAFVDAPSATAHYARGLIHGASVPTIEFATGLQGSSDDVPPEFRPCALTPADQTPDEICETAGSQLSLAEEDFLDLPNQEMVEAYFEILVDIGAKRGEYSDADQERVMKIVMGDEYTVGQAGAVGPGSHAENMTFVQNWNQVAAVGDADALAADLAKLREHLHSLVDEPEQDIAIAALAEAEIEAKSGNGPEALERLSRLNRLKGAGKWALGAATAIGTTVAAAALRVVLGI